MMMMATTTMMTDRCWADPEVCRLEITDVLQRQTCNQHLVNDHCHDDDDHHYDHHHDHYDHHHDHYDHHYDHYDHYYDDYDGQTHHTGSLVEVDPNGPKPVQQK